MTTLLDKVMVEERGRERCLALARKRLHVMDGGNYRGTIEIVEIHRHPTASMMLTGAVVKKVA
jgi:hypothetical protein